MLDICLIGVKTKLKKPWQPIVVYGNKKYILELLFLTIGYGSIAVKTTCLYNCILSKKKNSLSLKYGRDMF